MPTFGDTSQFSALMSNMLANARNRPMAAPGHKVLALSGSSPAISNVKLNNTATQTNANVDLGGILSLFGKHPEQLKAKQDQDRKDAEMAWIHYNTDISPQDREKMYNDPRTQGLFDKWEKANPALFRNNPDTGRKELLPMSPDMMNKILGIKGLTKEQVLTLPDDHPIKQNYINGIKASQPPTEAGLAGPQLIQDKYRTAADLNKARAGEATAGASLKNAETTIVPQLGELRTKQGNLADAQTEFLNKDKGQGAKITQDNKELNQKTINSTMGNFHKSWQESTKVDYRYGTEEYGQQLNNRNSVVVGAINQLKQYKALPEMAGVVGAWIPTINKELSMPPKMVSGQVSPVEVQRLTGIRDSIKQVVQAAGMDLPDYQKMAIAEMIDKTNQYLGIGQPKGKE